VRQIERRLAYATARAALQTSQWLVAASLQLACASSSRPRAKLATQCRARERCSDA
jgi:hypothetical protein